MYLTLGFLGILVVIGSLTFKSKQHTPRDAATPTNPVESAPRPHVVRPTPADITRAHQMLDLAVDHAEADIARGGRVSDTVRSHLNRTLPILRHKPAGLVRHLAATAYIYALEGRVEKAKRYVALTNQEMAKHRGTLPPDVIKETLRRCSATLAYNQLRCQIQEAMALLQEADQCHPSQRVAIETRYQQAKRLVAQTSESLAVHGAFLPSHMAKQTAWLWIRVMRTQSQSSQTRDFAAASVGV